MENDFHDSSSENLQSYDYGDSSAAGITLSTELNLVLRDRTAIRRQKHISIHFATEAREGAKKLKTNVYTSESLN